MARRVPEETVDRAYALRERPPALCLSVARDGFEAFVVVLPPSGTISVGRDPQAALSIGSPSLSRLHFALEVRDEAATVRDLGSRNGTLLEQQPISDTEAPAALGAEIVAGDVRFTLLRLASVPSGARPLLLLGPFEAALASAPAGAVVHAFELTEPFNRGPAALDLIAQLPPSCEVALVNDTTLVARAPDSSAITWLARALPQRGVAIARQASRTTTASSSAILATVLDELAGGGADGDAASAGQAEVPEAFSYPSLRVIHEQLRRLAPRPISVLVTGETGTGKEIVAREIHRLSRRTGPLVAVNTAALPENLIESELFGHERGAFSGAQTAKAGLIESADKGTLFLDEIGELSLPLQAKLLRVLEEQSVRRVGATVERKVDLRIIAATHQDLPALAEQKRFRQDLLFRLNGASIVLPPLRQRRGEVAALARRLLEGLAPGAAPSLDPTAEAALEAYDWPGNVRELKHVLERALAFADTGVITASQLPEAIARATTGSVERAGTDVRSTVKDFERERILEALRATGGNRTRAAELLGLPRRTLVYKLSKMRIDDE
ncbi:MAG: sigma 54-interacting transcriptional regulator [Polyangiaceae bacterium]|nr:sigma 54-interacting transcriptional regulator [Polyangiaceae bacterium]